MRFTIALLAMMTILPNAAVAQPTLADRNAPFKLILSIGGSTVVIDYATRGRCLAAQAAINEENGRRTESARQRTEAMQGPGGQGGMVIASVYSSFCIPG